MPDTMASASITTSGMISIGTHSLYLSICGPPRVPGKPIVLILPGLACSINEWVVVRRLLEPTTNMLFYERSGLGLSEESPDPPTAVTIVTELNALLKAADIKPPYVIVCHSYGGILSREFIHLRHQEGGKDDIVGVVFVDANQEKSYQVWPNPELAAVDEGLDFNEVLGLNKDRSLSDEEWQTMQALGNTPKYKRTAEAEMKYYVESVKALGLREQLEMDPPLLNGHPVSVLKGNTIRGDREKMYQAGVAAGNGTPEERALYRAKLEKDAELDERFQREHLKLSTNHRFVTTMSSGHNIQLTEPELIAKEVERVMANLVE